MPDLDIMDRIIKTMHTGRKIGRMRELLGVKQETLAAKLGTTQQAISRLEQSEQVDPEKLDQVAKALGVSSEAIKNLNEDTIFTNINNFNAYEGATLMFETGSITNQVNPIERIVELAEKNTRLYERLLQNEREKVAMLEKLLKTIKKE